MKNIFAEKAVQKRNSNLYDKQHPSLHTVTKKYAESLADMEMLIFLIFEG